MKESIQGMYLTLFLSYRLNQHEELEIVARSIRKCAKILHRKTSDKGFREILHRFRDEKSDETVIRMITRGEQMYFIEKKERGE